MPSRHKGSDASILAFLPPGSLEDPGGRCFLEWSPYLKDRTMGLNHQAASLSCALGEAFFLNRTLLLPDSICLFALHTERWRGAGQPSGERCVPLGEVWDVPLISQLVPIQLVPHNFSAAAAATTAARGGRAATAAAGSVVSVGKGWKSARVRSQYPCHPASPTERRVLLVRRQVESFWFQQCTRSITDHRSLAQRVNELLGAPASAPRPMNILLRSGLFFARHIKEAATAVQAHIGGSYVSLHVRRSDKLTACTPEECRTRDEATRPAALLRALDLWFPRGTHVYIGSTERPAYFELLRERYTLHFAEDYSQELNNVTRGAVSNNYALYALETLLFFGSQAACALRPHCACTAPALHLHCACTASAPHVHCMCTACAPHAHAHCLCTACAPPLPGVRRDLFVPDELVCRRVLPCRGDAAGDRAGGRGATRRGGRGAGGVPRQGRRARQRSTLHAMHGVHMHMQHAPCHAHAHAPCTCTCTMPCTCTCHAHAVQVLYGRACLENAPCGRAQHLVPHVHGICMACA